MPRGRYLRLAVITVTLVSAAVSTLITLVVESFTPEPAFKQGSLVAVIVPLLVAPPLAYWHHRVLYQLEESKRKIRELSRTDDLTGLYNRRYFFELAKNQQALAERHGHPLTLLVVDLDHFKEINDQYGHHTGDQVLRFTAQALAGSVRTTDLLARYGGEEFVVLLPQTTDQEALALCRRIRRELALAQSRRDDLPRVTMSIGAACSIQHGCELDNLLMEADQALYLAKAAGRDTCMLAGSYNPGKD